MVNKLARILETPTRMAKSSSGTTEIRFLVVTDHARMLFYQTQI